MRNRKASLAVLALLLAASLLSGCTLLRARGAPGEEPRVDPSPPPQQTVKLTLYFADSQAQYLVPEEREVAQGSVPLPDLVVQELIKGPTAPGLGLTIPREARLLSPVRIEDRVAYVNFNREFQSRHWGGSAGELITVYSIVNSLTELEGIDAVALLVEGEKLETLGHMDLTRPVERREDLIQK